MARPILSAFADEYKTEFDGQIAGLTSFGINNIEVRFIDGVNISAVTPEALKAAKKKLDDAKISVSALGSPLGKVNTGDDLDAELARAEKMIGKSLDAKVTVYTNDNDAYATLSAFADKLAETYITSAAYVTLGDAPEGAFTETQTGIAVKVEPADGQKCDRCWSYSTEGVTDEEGGFLCERCRKILL